MRSAALAAVVAVFGFASSPVMAGAEPARPPIAVAAKSCSAGYVHAVIGGAQKCLRRGEFCAHRYNSQYHRYGFACTRRDDRGNYHLT